MATVLAGFRPVKHMNGSPYNGQVNRYMLSADDAQVTNIGDLVILSDQAALVDTAGGGVYPCVERAASATSSAIVGAVVGFEPDYSNLNAGMYRAASTRRVAWVADAPDLLFAVKQDGTAGVVAAASVGLNVSLVIGTGASTAPYASTMMVDSSEVDTTATDPLQIMGVVASPDNDVTSTSRPAELLVRINTHAFNAAGLAGV
jgi:hypothetical protein